MSDAKKLSEVPEKTSVQMVYLYGGIGAGVTAKTPANGFIRFKTISSVGADGSPTDLDDITETGVYILSGNSFLHAPYNLVSRSPMEVYSQSDNTHFQTIRCINNGRIYNRTRFNGAAWSNWTALAEDSTYVDPNSRGGGKCLSLNILCIHAERRCA